MDTKLNGKAASNHTHAYAASSHTHDDRYYTESEMNTKLSGKSDTHSHPYLNTANVANNLTTTSAGYALDARQGKVVQDQISIVNAKIESLYLEGVTVTLSGSSLQVTAPTIANRTFTCWISASSRGWVGCIYFEDPSHITTNIWKAYGDGGTAVLYALYRNA